MIWIFSASIASRDALKGCLPKLYFLRHGVGRFKSNVGSDQKISCSSPPWMLGIAVYCKGEMWDSVAENFVPIRVYVGKVQEVLILFSKIFSGNMT